MREFKKVILEIYFHGNYIKAFKIRFYQERLKIQMKVYTNQEKHKFQLKYF